MLSRVNIWHLFVKAIIKYYYKHQLKKITKVARPANSALSVALVTVDSSRWLDPQNPLTQTKWLLCTDFFPLNTPYIACFRLSVILNILHSLPIADVRSPIVIGDNNREYLIHQPWIHGTSLMWEQISRHSQRCWNSWLHMKLEHNHRHLMVSIKSDSISSKLVTSLLKMPTWSSISVLSPVHTNRLVLLCR